MGLLKFLGPHSGNPILSGMLSGILLVGGLVVTTLIVYRAAHDVTPERKLVVHGYEVLVVTKNAEGKPTVSGRYQNARVAPLKDGSTLIYWDGGEVITRDEVVTKF